MPWITATTATRNPTHAMIPSSVKNERSLWLHAVWRAWRIASERGMAGKLKSVGEVGGGCGGRVEVNLHNLPNLHHPPKPIHTSQRRPDRVAPRGWPDTVPTRRQRGPPRPARRQWTTA